MALLLFAAGAGPLLAQSQPASPSESPSSPTGAAAAVRIEAVRVGFGGTFKVGQWTPLWVTLTADRACTVSVVVETPDPDEITTLLQSEQLTLKAGQPQVCEMTFRTARAQSDVRVRVLDESGANLATRRIQPAASSDAEMHPGLKLDVPFWATLGHPAGFDQVSFTSQPADVGGSDAGRAAAGPVGTDREPPPEVVALDSAAVLPRQADGYDGLNTLIVTTGQPAGQPNPIAELDAAQDRALREWVQMGGHLVLSVGSRLDDYSGSLPARWIPVDVQGSSRIRQLSALESYSGKTVPLVFSGALPGLRLGPAPGRVLVEGLDGPLVVRMPVGFGWVTFVALDIDRPPLSTWPAWPVVARKLAQVSAPLARARIGTNSQLSHLGITDLASQVNAAQEVIGGANRLSYWSVMGLILLYVAIIGPLDYLLVTRLIKRPELTWVTFPLLVAAATAGSVWGANLLNGDRLLVNQLTLLDVDAESGLARGHAWVTLYSPDSRRYAVSVEPDSSALIEGGAAVPPAPPTVAHPDVRLSWNAVPESSIGGLYRPGALSVSGRSYDYTAGARAIQNLPVLKWSTKALLATWREEHLPSLVESRLESAGAGRLNGSVVQTLPVPLADCLLVYGGRVYFPRGKEGQLAPHQEWSPGQGQQRDLRSFLTGTTAHRVELSKDRSEVQFKPVAYDPLSRDRGELIRMLTFHRASGGEDYTGLANAALSRLELTPQMQAGQAVLLGRIERPVTRLKIDHAAVEDVDETVFVRFVLPVKYVRTEEVRQLPKPPGSNEPSP